MPSKLQQLRLAAAGCRECLLGEGPPQAPLMLVGKQPGDREGHPFVGPARRLLDQALAELGLDREAIYVTNAVKHFKYVLRGKRRMHKTPAQREVEACNQWLDGEIQAVRPGRDRRAGPAGPAGGRHERARAVAGARGRHPGAGHPAPVSSAAPDGRRPGRGLGRLAG